MIIDEEILKNKIYFVRGKNVMLDSDLARIYGYTTKDFNRQVKNNIERFDNDFRFQLTKEEYYDILRCKNSTLELKQGQYAKYLPHVFTEEGIYMLMTVLKGERAIKQSKTLIRLFKSMKNYIIDNNLTKDYISYVQNLNLIEGKLIEHDNDIKLLRESFEKLEKKEKKNSIYFNGELFNAYSKIIDILNSAKEEIIIIDSYADKKLLDIIKDIDKKVIIINRNNNLLKCLDIETYNKQFSNLEVRYDDSWHDRYIILDKEKFYSLGTSFNYLGNKTFGINMIDDIEIKYALLNKIN